MREDAITSQIKNEIQKVSLCSAWAENCINELEKEKMETAQAESSFAQKTRDELVEIESKIDKFLEPLTKLMDVVEANADATERKEGFVDVRAAFVSDAESSELMKPANRALYDPAQDSKSTSVAGVSARDECADSPFGQCGFVRRGMIRAFGNDIARAPLGMPHFSPHRWNRVDKRDKLGYIVAVCAGDGEGKWNALSVRDDMVLAAEFAAIGWIGASLLPPKTARTLDESTTHRDQSSWSALCNCASNTSYTRCHTPNSCHLARRRQQVIPHPHPNSCGKYSHGIPVRSTNKMPVSALRLATAGRPLLLGGLSGGRRGSMSVHKSSGKIARAIYSSMQPVKVAPDSLALCSMYRKINHEL